MKVSDTSTYLEAVRAEPATMGEGHVCEHGVRWPHECKPCADAAWEASQAPPPAPASGETPTEESIRAYFNAVCPDTPLTNEAYIKAWKWNGCQPLMAEGWDFSREQERRAAAAESSREHADCDWLEMRAQLTAAEAAIEANDSDSIVASCNCFTKTHLAEHHKRGCKYRLIVERDAARADKERLDWLETLPTKAAFGKGPSGLFQFFDGYGDLAKPADSMRAAIDQAMRAMPTEKGEQAP